MARRRFFVDEVRGGKAEISGEDARHLTRVLRVERGQRYEISDNHSVWLAEVETAHKEQVLFRVVEKVPARPESARMMLMPALIKFDHLEWMIEKATELGVDRIVPFAAERTEHGLDRAAAKRVDRWRKIALEASQQSRRDRVPKVENATFAEVLSREVDYRFVMDEQPGVPELLSVIPGGRKVSDTVAILLGPEGGWTDQERRAIREAGWVTSGLGPLVLRAETAAMAALAVLTAAWRLNPRTID